VPSQQLLGVENEHHMRSLPVETSGKEPFEAFLADPKEDAAIQSLIPLSGGQNVKVPGDNGVADHGSLISDDCTTELGVIDLDARGSKGGLNFKLLLALILK
jgi:hypothetical protein